MDHNEEYHDPDYPGTAADLKKEAPVLSEEERIAKIKDIIHREFANELKSRENEIAIIDQRMTASRRMLHRLRYTLVSNYYRDLKLQLGPSQIQDEIASQQEPRARNEVTAILRDGQRRIHPSVRKLLGKGTVDLEEIFKSRTLRNKSRKDYSAMVQSRNYTIPADTTKSLRPADKEEPEGRSVQEQEPSTSRPKKVPRHLEPKLENVLTLDEITRNKMKTRYRIIIGNTSKYAPAASRADRSTHKWLLYVRGPRDQPAAARVLTAVTVRLHHSYAPHHTVHIDKPPYHISRRGWGEFPAKIELHFALPERNRPATVEHTIKLDRNYTGLQTLGAETVVDVWLYSTQEMLQYAYKEDTQTDTPTDTQMDIQTKQEPVDTDLDNATSDVCEKNDDQADNWLDFFTTDNTELDVDEMIIKSVKKENVDDESDVAKDVEEVNDVSHNFVHDEIKEEREEIDFDLKTEPQDSEWGHDSADLDKATADPWESLPNELLNQPNSPKKRIMKYMDPITGKIYYLEMDRNLDLSKVQEIVINSKGNVKTARISPIMTNGVKNLRKNLVKGGVSLLKPEVKSLLRTENSVAKLEKRKSNLKKNFTHIENDHCYLGAAWAKSVTFAPTRDSTVLPDEKLNSTIDKSLVKSETAFYNCLCVDVARFNEIRVAVNYLLKKIPLICERARDADFSRHFPFVVENEEKFWKLDFAKRRNIEWSRAKLINTMLLRHFKTQGEQIWRTKQILIFSRLHGYYPIRKEKIESQSNKETDEWSMWYDMELSKLDSNMKSLYPNAGDISSLTIFDENMFSNNELKCIDVTDSDEDIDIVECDSRPCVKNEVLPVNCDNLKVLPVECSDDRLMYMYIERKCADIGIELRNEDVGSGYSYSAVHAVLLSAMKWFAEELIRGALAAKLSENTSGDVPPPVWTGSSSSRTAISVEHVYRASSSPRLHALTSRGLAAEKKHTHSI